MSDMNLVSLEDRIKITEENLRIVGKENHKMRTLMVKILLTKHHHDTQGRVVVRIEQKIWDELLALVGWSKDNDPA